MPGVKIEVDEEDEEAKSVDISSEDAEPSEANATGIDVKMVLEQKDIQGLRADLLADAEKSG